MAVESKKQRRWNAFSKNVPGIFSNLAILFNKSGLFVTNVTLKKGQSTILGAIGAIHFTRDTRAVLGLGNRFLLHLRSIIGLFYKGNVTNGTPSQSRPAEGNVLLTPNTKSESC